MQISTLIGRITKEQPTISLEALLDELERPAFEAGISPDKVCQYACLFIARRNANLTGEPQVIKHNDEAIIIQPSPESIVLRSMEK